MVGGLPSRQWSPMKEMTHEPPFSGQPCIASIMVIHREMGLKGILGILGFTVDDPSLQAALFIGR